MIDGNLPPSGGPRTGLPAADAPDDDTVVKPTRGDCARLNDQILEEKTIKLRFAPIKDGDPVPPHLLHVHWTQAVQQAFGDQLQFFDNSNWLVPVIDPIRTEARGQMRFKLYGRFPPKRKLSWPPFVLGD